MNVVYTVRRAIKTRSCGALHGIFKFLSHNIYLYAFVYLQIPKVHDSVRTRKITCFATHYYLNLILTRTWKAKWRFGMIIYVCNVSTEELEAGGAIVWGILSYRGWLYLKIKTTLYKRNIIPCNETIRCINL